MIFLNTLPLQVLEGRLCEAAMRLAAVGGPALRVAPDIIENMVRPASVKSDLEPRRALVSWWLAGGGKSLAPYVRAIQDFDRALALNSRNSR